MLRYVPRTGLLEEVADILAASMPNINAANLVNVSRRCRLPHPCSNCCVGHLQ